MADAMLNGELALTYPESFHMMDSEELARVFTEGADQMWGIWDTENHMICSVTCNVSNKLVAGLVSTKDLIKRVEKKASKAYANASYKLLGFGERTVAGEKASEVSYTYAIGDIAQTGSALVFKHGAACYTVMCFERTELFGDTHRLYEDILASMKLV